MMTPASLTFRPVTAVDLPMLAGWMARAHWRQWWGDPDIELAEIRAMIEGHDTTRPFIILEEGRPVGYIQVWSIGDCQRSDWADKPDWVMHLPAEAVGVDISLADEDRLGQGVGTAALRAFVARLRAEGFETIIIDPDPANGRAVRAYAKAGFAPLPPVAGQPDDVLLMQLAPTPAHTTQVTA